MPELQTLRDYFTNTLQAKTNDYCSAGDGHVEDFIVTIPSGNAKSLDARTAEFYNAQGFELNVTKTSKTFASTFQKGKKTHIVNISYAHGSEDRATQSYFVTVIDMDKFSADCARSPRR
jgi:hypothetical protein